MKPSALSLGGTLGASTGIRGQKVSFDVCDLVQSERKDSDNLTLADNIYKPCILFCLYFF